MPDPVGVGPFNNLAPDKSVEGLSGKSGRYFDIFGSTGASADDSQVATIATVQSVTLAGDAGYIITAADGTSATTLATGTPSNVYVRFSGSGADGTGQDWLWPATRDPYLKIRNLKPQSATISFVAVDGSAVKLFVRRVY